MVWYARQRASTSKGRISSGPSIQLLYILVQKIAINIKINYKKDIWTDKRN